MILRAAPDNLILVADAVVEIMQLFVLPPEDGAEAGGILIGSHRGPHLDINECTVPMPGDVRRRFLFDRKDQGHDRAAKNAWHRSGHTLTYVGEWHTHPEDHPTPSLLDWHTWTKVMRVNRDSPVLFLIVGRKGIWTGLGHRGTVSSTTFIDEEASFVGNIRQRFGIMRSKSPIRSTLMRSLRWPFK